MGRGQIVSLFVIRWGEQLSQLDGDEFRAKKQLKENF